jgi:hypothetical protein
MNEQKLGHALCQTMMSSQVRPGSAGWRRTDPSFTMSIADPEPGAANWFILDREVSGGARRDRTDDLMLAKHALYQLSYGPSFTLSGFGGLTPQWEHRHPDPLASPPKPVPGSRRMVGPGRLELPTLRLSGVRSNHLSYGPMAARPDRARDRTA